jgi:hypothetical protein
VTVAGLAARDGGRERPGGRGGWRKTASRVAVAGTHLIPEA